MADNIELAENRSFPTPPPFYQSFTKQNLEALKQLRDSANINGPTQEHLSESARLQSLQVPEALRHLIPPEIPSEDEKYRVFTQELEISHTFPTLASNEVPQLFPSPTTLSNDTDTEWTVDRVYYLKKLTRSILLNFLELIGMLSTDSTQWQTKFEEIKVLFYNAHSLVNDYRGHQARETLITMMEERLVEKRREIDDIAALKESIGGIMRDFQDSAPVVNGANGLAIDGEQTDRRQALTSRKREQRANWQALNAEFGAD